jgi:AcrR family transcriptional regulator
MSPAVARTSRAHIVAAARWILEADGLDAVTMQSVALRVGVRAPSLYKHVRDRAALLAAIADAALDELAEMMTPLAREPDAAAGMRAVATAFRDFAQAQPRTYGILFMDLPQDARGSLDRFAAAAAPVLELAERMVGPELALETARLVTAFAHGFISLELAGAFRLGGDVDAAFHHGIGVLLDGIAAASSPTALAMPRRPGQPARPTGRAPGPLRTGRPPRG